jgi:AcrR family transcriptional regulator
MNESNTKDKILKAAQVVFCKCGFNGARMEYIAKEAGINRALLHYYFRSKDKMFELIFKQNFMAFVEGMVAINFSDLSLFEKIGAIVNHQVESNIKKPNLSMFILHELNSNPETILKIANHKSNGLNKAFQVFNQSVEDAYKNNIIEKIDARHLWINTISISMFPFLGKPKLKDIFSINEKSFFQLMEDRKKHVSEFIIQSIKKREQNEK